MRIWSFHPEYLDTIGLIALWREALLAKKVLEGNTKGYRSHPQLERFKNSDNPLDSINQYLSTVYNESVIRQFNFDQTRFSLVVKPVKMPVTRGQIDYEFGHLMNKLKVRDQYLYEKWKGTIEIIPNPVFTLTPGGIEKWERLV
jgi:hypothetical protein